MKTRKYILVAAVALLAGPAAAHQTVAGTPAQNYSIEVTVGGAPANTMVWFAMYSDDVTTVVDSLPTDVGGKVLFAGEQPLKAGMYKIYLQGEQSPFVDVFITDGEPQHFALSFDRSIGMASLEVHGSPENEFFADCLHFLNDKQQQAQVLNARMEQYQDLPDSIAIISARLQQFGVDMQNKWGEVYTAYPNSTLALFLKSVREPVAPEPSISPLTANRDSAMQVYYLNYYREHFFDNIDFSDARILRMPFLSNTFRIYYLRILPLDKDVLMERTEFLINKAKANREVYEYIVRNRYDFFRSAPYPELGGIAPAIAEKYIIRDSAEWQDKAFLARTRHFVAVSQLNPEGAPATNLILQDSTGKTIALYDVEAPYTILLFYNPQCHSCAAITPMLWEVYTQYRDKGLQVYAAYVDNNRTDWTPYLVEKGYNWINVWDADGSQGLYDKYNIHAIPLMYLLDKDKIILRKDITVEQLQEVLPQLFK
ncbi:MAG: redoxin domain-containing protein [Prevotellaceae bacterium]|jgi:thiol-disulfide isomerase/thioredoxin|nr:redoxin domain-containing protein [Prevotellaceae bacterium]